MLVGMYLIAMVFSLCSVIYGIRRRSQIAAVNHSWSRTNGWIISSNVVQFREQHSGSGAGVPGSGGSSTPYYRSGYRTEIQYGYEVEGRTYTSDNIDYAARAIGHRTLDQLFRLVHRYPSKARVQVYYDPSDPQMAVLEPGSANEGPAYIGVGLIGALVATLAFLILYALSP